MSKKRKASPVAAEPPTIDTLTICWSDRTVTFRGRTVGPIEANCVAFPVLSTERILLSRFDR